MCEYLYSPVHHFREALKRFQGNDEIPESVPQEIREVLQTKHITNPSHKTIKTILKELKLHVYYENIPTIVRRLTKGEQLNEITKIYVEQTECPVCFEEIVGMVKLNCKHLFCEECILQLKKDDIVKCPLCRRLQDMVNNPVLTQEQIDKLVNDFNKSYILYKRGKNFIPFDEIIRDIAKRNDIVLEKQSFVS